MTNNNVVLPGQTIGIIGGGQLGRMMAIEAKYMGYDVIVLDPTLNCPTAQVSDEQIVAPYDDLEAIKELTAKSDVVTYEFENVDLEAARYIEDEHKLPQGADLLQVTQNRDQEKQLIKDLSIPVSPFVIVDEVADCKKALEEIGFPSVIKTCHGGYDGKGQLKINSMDDLSAVEDFVLAHKQRCIIEHWITFDKEISVILTRDQKGEIAFFPLAENIHKDHILADTIAPARVGGEVRKKALAAARKIAERLNVVGSFAIEMFVKNDDIYINELAPRPHNSGHYTIEACNVNQFDQHIRAVCDLPLQRVRLLEQAYMKNILGEHVEALLRQMPVVKEGHVHLYGKAEAKEKRKMGHVTFTAQTRERLDKIVTDFEEDLT